MTRVVRFPRRPPRRPGLGQFDNLDLSTTFDPSNFDSAFSVPDIGLASGLESTTTGITGDQIPQTDLSGLSPVDLSSINLSLPNTTPSVDAQGMPTSGMGTTDWMTTLANLANLGVHTYQQVQTINRQTTLPTTAGGVPAGAAASGVAQAGMFDFSTATPWLIGGAVALIMLGSKKHKRRA